MNTQYVIPLVAVVIIAAAAGYFAIFSADGTATPKHSMAVATEYAE